MVGDPTDEILAIAGRLYDELGVNGTTMSRIASEAGLKQSSLYYYFRNRDEVTAALIERANIVPLELAASLASAEGSAAARLLLFVRGDVEALCNLPLDIGEIHRVAARDRAGFARYWKERRKLERLLVAMIGEAVAAGEFEQVDPALTALVVMGNDEGVQNWYRLGTRRKPVDIGRAVARLTIGGLLAADRSIDDVEAEADAVTVV